MITKDFFNLIAPKAKPFIVDGILKSWPYVLKAGISEPAVIAHFLAQLYHESGGFRFVVEVWGPTAAQQRYDVRTDLGNTPVRDGDGYAYRGRGLIQITGKFNYKAFTVWAKKLFDDAPDFVAHPEKAAEFPWAILSAVWYWQMRGLTPLARNNDILAISKKINGTNRTTGLPNGYTDRLLDYTIVAMALATGERLNKESIRNFQQRANITIDGTSGPETRQALHDSLVGSRTIDNQTDAAIADHKTRDKQSWTPTLIERLLDFATIFFMKLFARA